MMDGQSAFQLAFHFGTTKPVVVEPSAAQVSSDAGLLPFRQLDEQLGHTEQLVACLIDRRHVGYVGHTYLEMVRMRVYGILADYADQSDHDLLRSDPVFKLLCDRSIHEDDLATDLAHQARWGLRQIGTTEAVLILKQNAPHALANDDTQASEEITSHLADLGTPAARDALRDLANAEINSGCAEHQFAQALDRCVEA